MCIINHWLDNWECFMNARLASQGLGPSVCGAQSSTPFTCQEGESRKSLWPFPLCLINARMQRLIWKCFFSHCFSFPNNSAEMRKQTFRVLLRSPRPPSAAAVSRCRASALAAWRTSRCWRPSWGPVPTATSSMWWTPGPRSAHCEKHP